MGFSIIDETGHLQVLHLLDDETGTSAEIYAFGALLNAFTIKQPGFEHNVIEGFASPQNAVDHITAGFKSARLSPFVCRITAGRYGFEGKEYAIKKFFLGNEAIHGLLYDAVFAVTARGADNNEAYVTLEYNYNNQGQGYPFPFHSAVTYSLKKQNRLAITTKITNTGAGNMPLTDGWHPYFTLGGNINELLFYVNGHKILEFDERLVPTGKTIGHQMFNSPARIGNTFLDNCFVLNDNQKAACTLLNQANGLRLTISAKKNYPYLQVYTPPHRKSMAIENISGAPNAFNNGIGLIIAKPGEQFIFVTEYHLSR
jgi:aldose 1-epimerase